MKPLITAEALAFYSAHAEARQLISETLRRDTRMSDRTAGEYAWQAIDALAGDNLDDGEGGWLFIQGRVYRVIRAEQVDDGEDRDGVLWAVDTRRERDEQEDPE